MANDLRESDVASSATDLRDPSGSDKERRMARTQMVCLFILASAAVLTLAYVAKIVLVTVFMSLLTAFTLAPLVELQIRFRIPRAIAAFVAMLLLTGVMAGVSFLSYSKAVDFAQDLPKYKREIRIIGIKLQRRAEALRKTTENVLPESTDGRQTVTIRQGSNLSQYVTTAAWEFVFAISFIPFLSFFMLSWQNHLRSATVMLFKMESRNTAYLTMGLIASMIRSFIVGNILIGMFLSAVSLIVFGLLGVPYFYFIAFISGFLSLIPYLGVVLAMAPPLIALLGALTAEKAIIIVLTVLGLHVFALNVLYPKILGKRLQLNPVAVTIGLLFWGWLWGTMGLLLAVPITAALKIVLDHTTGFEGYGRWLGE